MTSMTGLDVMLSVAGAEEGNEANREDALNADEEKVEETDGVFTKVCEPHTSSLLP